MDPKTLSTFGPLFLQFVSEFTTPGYQNFVTLVVGWILCTGRHTISRVIQFSRGPGRKKHPSTLYRFFSRGVWSADAVGRVVFGFILKVLPDESITVIVDDTLCRKSGPHIWGAGMHHDPLASTYGRGTQVGRKVAFAFGHDFVVMSLSLALPWNRERTIAVPILIRLYRSKKRTPKEEYQKRTEMARDMFRVLLSWIPKDRRLRLVGDTEYACQTLVRDLPERVVFVGPMAMDAAVYEVPEPPPPAEKKGKGRPRKKGKRLPSPEQLAADSSVPWEHRVVSIYGRNVNVLVKTKVVLWYTVSGTQPVRMVVTRDPKAQIDDRAYFSTDPTMSVEEILHEFSRRWGAEVMHRDVKQSLGLEHPQNGWWRRRQGTRCPPKRPAPNAHRRRGEMAVRRTVPLAFFSYALVVVWYLQHGSFKKDVRRARKNAPWYRQKKEPSFADMLRAARRQLWHARFSAYPSLRAVSTKIMLVLPDWLLAA